MFLFFWQDQEDFLECMQVNAIAPKNFSETFHRCQVNGFLERQSFHSSIEGYRFDQNNHTIELKAWPYICPFSIFIYMIIKHLQSCLKKPNKRGGKYIRGKGN